MIKHNLKEIVNFTKSNNDFSDFNIVNNFKLNFTKYKSINSKKQFGGSTQLVDPSQMQVDPSQMQLDPSQMQVDPSQMQVDPSQMHPSQMQASQGQPSNQVLQVQPDTFLSKPAHITDAIETYTIPVGTILFYSSTEKRGFNTTSLQLNGPDYLNNSLEKISFFTPNFRLASDKIQGCSIDKQKGYIHTFRVTREIPDIFIKLPYDTNEDISLPELHKEFCEGTNKYTGVGFFYPKNEIESFNNMTNANTTQEIGGDNYYSEFYLCNPRPYLEYMYSQKCMSLRKLTDPYKFT